MLKSVNSWRSMVRFLGLELGATCWPIYRPHRQIVVETGKILQQRKRSLESQRKHVVRSLSARKKPILVVLDDIDRLTKSEIREVFKLVRLTANFPK